MFVPIILGSDKTTVSVATGQTDYYPLYISTSVVHNNVHHAHQGAISLVSFLSIAKSKSLSQYLLPITHIYTADKQYAEDEASTSFVRSSSTPP